MTGVGDSGTEPAYCSACVSTTTIRRSDMTRMRGSALYSERRHELGNNYERFWIVTR